MTRPFRITEWLIALLGFLTPIYFYLSILFLTDNLGSFASSMQLGVSLPAQIQKPLYHVGVISGILVLLLAGFYALNESYSRMAISVRRGWSAIIIYFVFSIITSVISPQNYSAAWYSCLPPLALLTAQALNIEKSKRFITFTFYFFIALIIFSQATYFK